MTYISNTFPTSIQTGTDPIGTDEMSTFDHAGLESFQNDSILALKNKVGVDSSVVNTSYDYKLSGVATGDKAVSKTGTETLTNKTLTSPSINTPTITGGTVSGITLSGTNTLGGTNTFSGTNTVTGATTFNTSLPTSSVTPTNSSDLTTKTYVDSQALPSQTGNSGKFVTTNGSSASWVAINNQYSNSGVTTRAGNTASGTQTIAHGLGITPKKINITVMWTNSGAGGNVTSIGTYNGTTNSCVYNIVLDSGNGNVAGSAGNSSTLIAYVPRIQAGSPGNQSAVATFDSTNITLTWTLTDSMAATNMNIMWEAIG